MNIALEAEKDTNLNLSNMIHDNINGIEELYDIILSSLSDIEQTILRAASIIGKSFNYSNLLYLLPEHKEYLRHTLSNLISKHIIEHLSSEGDYCFKHDLQYNRIYQNNNKNEKWAWHLTLAEEYKKQRNYSLSGYHYYFAESYNESVKYLTFTARKLLKEAQPNKSEIFFTRAFDAFEKSLQTHKPSYFKLQVDYCYSLLMQGRLNIAQDVFSQIKNNTKKNSDHYYHQVLGLEIKIKWMSGDYNKKYIVDLLDTLPSTPSFFTDRSRLVWMLSDIGEHHESIKATENLLHDIKNEKLWKDRAFSPTKIACSVLLSLNHVAVGKKKEALTYIESNIQEINSTKDNPQKIHTLTFTAEALHKLGNYEDAKPLIEKAYLLNLDFKIGVISPHILSQYAHSLSFFGNTLKAIELFNECISFIEENSYISNISYYKMLMAKAYSSIGLNRVAVDILYNAKKIALKQNNNNYLAIIYYELFQISVNAPDIADSELQQNSKNYLQESFLIAQRLGLKPLINRCKSAYKFMH
jgi:tetratricopeptide (TPR) repeat protein